MPICLAFDAGSPVTSAAVARDGVLLSASSGESRSGPSLLHHVDASLRQAGIAMPDLDGVVALGGPGSFTGIRITLATALGFRSAATAPVLALSTLAALALHAAPEGAPRILALIDALRDEWFVQEFRPEGPGLAALGAPERLPAAAVAAPEGAVLAAHESQPLPAHLATIAVRRAAGLAAVVATAASAGRIGSLLCADLEPLYLRAFTPRSPQV